MHSTTFSLDRSGGASERMEEGDSDDEVVELRPPPRAPTLRQTTTARRKLD